MNESGYLPDIHRSLPQSLDAEKGVLCSALLSPTNVLNRCIDEIREEFFYQPSHQIIYREMLDLQAAAKSVDFITLTQVLKDKGELDKAGGAASISELFTFVPTASNADYYIEIVREKFLLRTLIQTCTEFAGRAYDEQGEASVLLDQFESKVLGLGVTETRQSTVQLRHLIPAAIARYEAAFKNDTEAMMGLTTGFKRLDMLTGGMLDEQMIVIGAREKFGKSAIAMCIAIHVAKMGKGVGIFSLEMSQRQLVDRYFGAEGKVNLATLKTGEFTQGDLAKITKASTLGNKIPLFIRTEADMTVTQLRASARALHAKEKIALLVVDYLQLVSAESKRSKNSSRQEVVAEISRNLKLCAKELNIPVIVLSQLNDDGETRESKALQQDCDQFWRILPVQANADDSPKGKGKKTVSVLDIDEVEEEASTRPCVLEVKFNREGSTGRVPMEFLRNFTFFQERVSHP